MIDWNNCLSVEHDPQGVSGVWVFHGTRVPVVALLENLGDGVPVSEFLEYFPGVNNTQVQDVLHHAAKSLDTA